MKSFLNSFVDTFKNASGASKAIAVMVVLALSVIVGTAAVVANQPHFEILWGGLDDVESARVAKALADAALPFEISQPPGPYVVYVDESDRIRAMQVVASAGALEHAPSGISAGEPGMSTVFMSASERAQVVLKREWQEAEALLEQGLDFVAKARVQTSATGDSAFERGVARTASVTIQLRGGGGLTRTQARTVADLVRFALRIEPENLIVSDQSGNTVYNGADLDAMGGDSDWLDQKLRYDRHLADEANQLLSRILGPDKARVTLNSEWDHDLSTQVSQTTDPDARVVVSETSSSTKTPHFPPTTGEAGGAGAAGGLAGTASNLGDSGGTGLAASGAGPAPAEPATAQTKQDRKDYLVPRLTTQTVRTAPVLRKLSVSLFLDESLAERQESLVASVRTAVGFDETRGDEFSVTTLPFAVPEEVPEEEVGAVGTLESPLAQTLLRRGVELLSALVFLFVLFKAIRGAREIASGRKGPPEEQLSGEALEKLATAQVEELIKRDPEELSRILSSWAREEVLAGSGQ